MGQNLKIHATAIEGVVLVDTRVLEDERGAFSRLYCERELASVLRQRHIVQVNRSLTRKSGAIRGMHFQHAPHAEMKLIRCLRGRVWDVAVDIRAGSPTFLHWHAEELTPNNGRMMVVPEGCAHGFQVLEDDSELLYLHTAFYEPSAEAGLLFDDPRLAIKWPLPVTELSRRDREHAPIAGDFAGIRL